MKRNFWFIIALLPLVASCSSSRSSKKDVSQPGVIEYISSAGEGQGQVIELTFLKGPTHNHPLMAVWVEDMEGNYLQTLYVARSIAKGVFTYGTSRDGVWAPGERRRPAALPRWGHQRGIKASDGYYAPDPATAVPDAYSGATPKSSFQLTAKLDKPAKVPFKVFFEINQSWDWNAFWSNTKFPDNEHYKTSSQPALVYAAVLDPAQPGREVELKLIGRSHHAGEDGNLYDDLHTMTTALTITAGLRARILP